LSDEWYLNARCPLSKKEVTTKGESGEATFPPRDLSQEVASKESWEPSQQLCGHLFGECTRPVGRAEVVAATRPAPDSAERLPDLFGKMHPAWRLLSGRGIQNCCQKGH